MGVDQHGFHAGALAFAQPELQQGHAVNRDQTLRGGGGEGPQTGPQPRGQDDRLHVGRNSIVSKGDKPAADTGQTRIVEKESGNRARPFGENESYAPERGLLRSLRQRFSPWWSMNPGRAEPLSVVMRHPLLKLLRSCESSLSLQVHLW